MMQTPCRGCPDRKPATETSKSCHGTCEKYLAFVEERKEYNAERLRQSDGHNRRNPNMMRKIYREMRWK